MIGRTSPVKMHSGRSMQQILFMGHLITCSILGIGKLSIIMVEVLFIMYRHKMCGCSSTTKTRTHCSILECEVLGHEIVQCSHQ